MPLRHSQRVFLALALMLVWLAIIPSPNVVASATTSFRQVVPEELKLTSEPGAPGASAIILYREVNRDDRGLTAHEDDYFRIKILTEEGRKYGDVEIPFFGKGANIVNIHARTIKPDGSIVDFDGKPFTKTVVKAHGLKYLAKTLSLPAVQPGCIIEYFYTIDLPEYQIVDSRWILSNELFTKAGDFSLNPYTSSYENWRLSWLWRNMPPGQPEPKEGPDHIIRLHVTNVPAFPIEDFMPPENEVKARVDFTYSLEAIDPNVEHFWQTFGKKSTGSLESFVGKPKALEQAVAQTVSPNDPPEVKLRKLYARVQQMRNTSYELEKTAEEQQRTKQKEATTAEGVWKRGYGNGSDLTWLYLGLVRAAGFEAYGMLVAERADYFFDPRMEQSDRVRSNLVVVKLNGKNIYCDPGAAFTPFGLLPWAETWVQGLQLDKKDSTWIPSLQLAADQARTERKARVTLSETGDLEGKLTVTFTGLEAAEHRREEMHADDAARKTYLEDLVKDSVPAACEVKLTNQPDWKSTEPPLVAEFDFKVPGWASAAGRRVMFPAGLFGAHEKHVFDHDTRVHAIYFPYPYSVTDDIDIKVPDGWKVTSLPQGQEDSRRVVTYSLMSTNNNGTLHFARSLSVDFVILEAKYYSALRNYYQRIKTGDDEQIVLEPGAARAGK